MKEPRKKFEFTKFGIGIVLALFGSFIFSTWYLNSFYYRASDLEKFDTTKMILNMQANTLTITAVSISLIGLLVAIYTIKRENDLKRNAKELEGLLQESKKIIETSKQALQTLSYLSVYNSLDDIALFSSKEKYLEQQLNAGTKENGNEEFVILFTLAKYYLDTSSKLGKDSDKIAYLQKAIKYSRKIIDQESEELRQYLAYIILGDAFYQLADLDKYSQNNERREYISFALDNYDLAFKIDPDDPQGSIQDKIGLCYFWQYKTDIDFFQNMKNPDYLYLLERANMYFKKAIEKNSSIGKYHNNVGCCLLQQHKIQTSDENESAKILDEAMKCFLKVAMLDVSTCKPWINMSDILVVRIKKLMKIDKINLFSLRLNRQLICSSLESKSKEEIFKLLTNAKENLNRARTISPLFVNTYYKLAEVEMYSYLFSSGKEQKKMKEYIDSLFEQAGQISPSSVGLLRTQRTYFDLVGNVKMAKEINDKIRKNNIKNAEEWDNLINNTPNEPDAE